MQCLQCMSQVVLQSKIGWSLHDLVYADSCILLCQAFSCNYVTSLMCGLAWVKAKYQALLYRATEYQYCPFTKPLCFKHRRVSSYSAPAHCTCTTITVKLWYCSFGALLSGMLGSFILHPVLANSPALLQTMFCFVLQVHLRRLWSLWFLPSVLTHSPMLKALLESATCSHRR